MAVPRNRMSNARKNSRRAHHAKKPSNATACSHCGVLRLSHHLCPSCGYYDNKSVLKEVEKSE